MVIEDNPDDLIKLPIYSTSISLRWSKSLLPSSVKAVICVLDTLMHVW